MTRLLMTADRVGGVWQYATELAAALRPHGVETTLAVMGPSSAPPTAATDMASDPGSDAVRIVETGLPLDWLAADAATVATAGDAIATLAREVEADLVQLNSPALAARTRFPVPVVAVAHGCVGTWWQAARGTAPDAGYAWHAAVMAAGLAAADAIVAPSAAFAAALRQVYALGATPLVVHNGRTAPAADPAAVEAEPVDGVFTAGRLWDEVKNTARLDRVAALIRAPFRAAGAVTGPHGEAVTIAHLDHLGMLDAAAMAAQLAGRPIYVSAARFEPFGLSVLEAAAAGCPLVLSDIATFRELWSGAALLVAEDTAEAYAAAIERTRADPALRTHLGEAARLRAARYTPAEMASAMAAIYAGLLARPVQAAA